MSSIISERPDPFAPPCGRSVSASRGSVVGLPLRSRAHPAGIGWPVLLAWTSRPRATTPVDMSSTTGPRAPPGTAIESGFVDTPATRVPW